MEGKNLFTGFIISQIIWLFSISIIMYMLNIRIEVIYFIFIYTILAIIYYAKAYIDFSINSDFIKVKGNLISTQTNIFYKKDIIGLEFTEIDLFFFNIKKVKILFSDNNQYIFYCNGVFSSDIDLDGIITFDNLYDYAKGIFPNTSFVDYTFFNKSVYKK